MQLAFISQSINYSNMEESLKILVYFLNAISWAETEADDYRIKLMSLPNAASTIFQSIDTRRKGTIDSVDICEFCLSRGLKIGLNGTEVVGRYFRNWGQAISLGEFAAVLEPKNLTHQQSELENNDPLDLFLHLVRVVVGSYINLEEVRQQLTQNCENIVAYFERQFGSAQGITKQSLRAFMIDAHIYTRPKFAQISSYIFGQVEQIVEWSNFFIMKKQPRAVNKKDKIQQSVVFQLKSEYGSRSSTPKKPESRFKNDSTAAKKPRKQCSNIQQVLDQIEQIEQTMKDKKLKNQRKKQDQAEQDQKAITLQEATKNLRSNLVGKVVPANSKGHIKKTESVLFNPSEEIGQQADSETFLKRYEGIMNKRPYQRCLNGTRTSSQVLKKSVSEAQLKIEQIEKRAMDKYLSKRKDLHLPEDYSVPYYHQESLRNYQMLREHGAVIGEASRLRKMSKNEAYYPIYSRHRVSRLLYENDTPTAGRPVSPGFLRY